MYEVGDIIYLFSTTRYIIIQKDNTLYVVKSIITNETISNVAEHLITLDPVYQRIRKLNKIMKKCSKKEI
jgi:hypothetical protein